MHKRSSAVVALVFAFASASHAKPATSSAKSSFPNPLTRFGPNLVDAFGVRNLVWHDGAVAATGVMAFSGADHTVRLAFQNHHPLGLAVANGAFWGGYIAPSVVSLAIYAVGAVAQDPDLAGAGCAALQALSVTALDTGLLKWATGRPFPVHGGDPRSPYRLQPGYATEFLQDPFTFRGNLAWPSGHTSTSVSVAAALSAYYLEHVWIPLVGYPTALLIGAGMIEGDHHWASDVLAGAMIGHAIGYSIGGNFRALRDKTGRGARSQTPTLWAYPFAGAQGLMVAGSF